MADTVDNNEEVEVQVTSHETLSVIDHSGQPAGIVELPPEWLVRNKGDQAVHEVIVAYRAAQRSGTASTKNRSEIRGSGAKPWRQKGTGRARAGSRKGPLWRGGGVIFGPRPRDFSKKVNKKVMRLALRRAFTARFDENVVRVIEKFELAEPKTAQMASKLKELGVGADVLIIVENYDNHNLLYASSNLPQVEIMDASSVNVYQILLYRQIIMTKNAFNLMGERLG